MTILDLALLAIGLALAVSHLSLSLRHRRCKRTLERVAAERNKMRAAAWERSQAWAESQGLPGQG